MRAKFHGEGREIRVDSRLQQGRFANVTTFPFTCGSCAPPAWYWQEQYRQSLKLATIQETTILDPPYGRPGLARANSTGSGTRPISIRSSTSSASQTSTQTSSRSRRHSQPALPPTLAERIALGPQLNPYHSKNPHRLDRYTSVRDVYLARQEQRTKEAAHQEERLHQLRLEKRRGTRQFDGSRSAGTSPALSRTNSNSDLTRTSSLKNLARELTTFDKFGPIRRADTGDSTASSSGQSNKSKKSNLSRVLTADRYDRDAQRNEARQERQLREPGAGTNGEPDSPSHGGQRLGGLSGKHADKSTRSVSFAVSCACNRLTDLLQRTRARYMDRIVV